MQLFTNNASSTLAAAAASGDTTLIIQATDAAEFPSPSGSEWALLTLEHPSVPVVEIVKLVGRAGANLTVIRGQEGTAVQTWPVGTKVELRLTAGTVSTIYQTALSAPQLAQSILAGRVQYRDLPSSEFSGTPPLRDLGRDDLGRFMVLPSTSVIIRIPTALVTEGNGDYTTTGGLKTGSAYACSFFVSPSTTFRLRTVSGHSLIVNGDQVYTSQSQAVVNGPAIVGLVTIGTWHYVTGPVASVEGW